MAPAPLRTRPVQARSRAKVDALLDAADAVFLEMGFPAATTNHVAARAGSSIGGLYRFFPDKDALLLALAERYSARMQAMAHALSPPDPAGLSLAELVGAGIDGFNAFLVANPGFRTIVEQGAHPALQAGKRASNDAVAALLAARFVAYGGPGAAARAGVVGEVVNTVLTALQVLSVERDEAFRAAVVEESKAMVVGYLATRLGVDAHAPLGGWRPAP